MSNSHPSAKSLFRAMLPNVAQTWIRKYRQGRGIRESRATFTKNLRPSDIFLVGHPKSGNTWLAYMVAILIHNDRNRKINLSNVGDYVPTIHARDIAVANFNHLDSPRIFRNEGPVYPELYPKTIYIVRDPRSVLLSYYHHCIHDTGDHAWSLSDFVDEMLTHGCIKNLEPFLIRWDLHVTAWIDRARTQPVKIIKYEDLKENREAVLKQIIDFIGLSVSDQSLLMAAQRGAFNSMRNEEKTFGAESYAGEKGEKGFFVRKGKTDSWREEMPPAVIDCIQASFSSTMRQLGYLK